LLYAGVTPSNPIVGTISGDANQAAVAQIGNANVTNFTQTGGNNIVVVLQ
jgi:hypothetical protein